MREGPAALICRQPDMRFAGQAATGQQAVDVVREKNSDAVLMDLRMPVLAASRLYQRTGKRVLA